MRNENRVKKTNHISNLYPDIVHFMTNTDTIPSCCTTQGKNITEDKDKVTCNSCKRRLKRR